jgi:hypothetical protein
MAMVELPPTRAPHGDHKSLPEEFSQSGLQLPTENLQPTGLGCDAGAAEGVPTSLSCGCATVELLPVRCEPQPRPYLVSPPCAGWGGPSTVVAFPATGGRVPPELH